MPSKFLMRSSNELLARRFHYRGQLRRYENAKRNVDIREFWQSKVTAEMSTGEKLRAAHAVANEATSKKFNISRSQIRRALNDADYLMDEAALKLRIRELSDLATYIKKLPSQLQRVEYFEHHVAAAIQAKKSERYARIRAIKFTAAKYKITSGQVRRILKSFAIPRQGTK